MDGWEEVARAWGLAARRLDPWPGWLVCVQFPRTMARGELFVAIHGPRHDGHNFVSAALEAGALAAVVAADRLSGYTESVRSKLLAVRPKARRAPDLALKPFERDGGGAWQRLPARPERPQRRKFWRRCWPRGSAY